MLTIRQATIEDVPPLNSLILDHQHRYFTDYERHNKDELVSLVLGGAIIVLCRGDGELAGAVFFDDVHDDLYAWMRVIIKPEHLLQVRRQGVINDVIDRAFVVLGVRKIKAKVHEGQTGARKVLKKVIGFRESGFFRSETRVYGKVTGIYTFELLKSYWEKRKKYEQKSRKAEKEEPETARALPEAALQEAVPGNFEGII